MQTAYWPLFELRVETPRVTLRYPDDTDAITIADVAAAGVHDRGSMPFSIPWTDVDPPLLQRNTLQHFWQTRAHWSPDRWQLPMAVVVDGDIVGVQDVQGERFALLKSVATGSWLGRRYQGKGIGTEMRAAILHLAFAGLGAEYASSGAFADNDASIAVSRRLGYDEVTRRRVVRRDAATWMIDFRLERTRWEEQRRDDIVIVNLEPCLEMLGAE